MIIADVRSGQIETAAEFVSLYTDPGDVIRVGRHLTTMLSDAVRRWKAGDHSPETTRLVELYEIVRDALAVHAADTAVAEGVFRSEAERSLRAAGGHDGGGEPTRAEHRSSHDRRWSPRPAAARRRRA